jgi:copper(I)-binding protein
MRSLIRFMAAALLAAFAAGGELLAHDFRAGSLTIDHPWARATPAGAPVAAGYLVIENRGAAADRLMSTSPPAPRSTRWRFKTA